MQQFKNLPELIKYFSDEKTCWDYLEKKLWNGIPVCPHCGSTVVYRLANYKQFKCGNKSCDQKFTVTCGTIYQNTRISLATWFAAIWLTACHKKGISSHQLARDLSITQKTAWYLLHRIREMVKAANQAELDTEITVDETYIKGRAANRNKYQKKLIAERKRIDIATVVLGLQQDDATVLKVIPTAESYNLKKALDETIKDKNSILVTDGLPGYKILGQQYQQHVVINHMWGEYKKDGFTTNGIESAFSHFKRTIYGTYHFITPKHTQRYCDMFSYRYSTRKMKDIERFNDATDKRGKRLKYKVLINKIEVKKDNFDK